MKNHDRLKPRGQNGPRKALNALGRLELRMTVDHIADFDEEENKQMYQEIWAQESIATKSKNYKLAKILKRTARVYRSMMTSASVKTA